MGCSPAQRLRPHAENTQVQVSNGHSKLDGSVAGTAEAELPNLHFLDPKNHRSDSHPSQLQILSLYDCQGHNELQTDTVLKIALENTWRRKWQPTPVFLPGESHGWRSLVGCMQSMGSQKLSTNTHTHTHSTQTRASSKHYSSLPLEIY